MTKEEFIRAAENWLVDNLPDEDMDVDRVSEVLFDLQDHLESIASAEDPA
tara:strand:+ start:520 stop:669 length:150 start_codon:yes stop_codon:yes gene_type:complete